MTKQAENEHSKRSPCYYCMQYVLAEIEDTSSFKDENKKLVQLYNRITDSGLRRLLLSVMESLAS